MKMKKVTALLLAALLVLGLTACGGEGSDGSAPAPGESVSEPEVQPNQQEEQTPGVPQEVPAEFEEIILVDNESCTVKITGVEADGLWGYTWKVYLENKTDDKNMMFTLMDCAVNGAMCDPLWAESVAAGMKSNSEITWLEDSLAEYGIEQVTAVEGMLRVYDDDDWITDYHYDAFAVYPIGEEGVILVERQPQEGDILLVDNEQLQVAVTRTYEDEIWGYTMNLYIVNKTDKDVLVSIENCAVNGFMADPFWATTVSAGKVAGSDVVWLTDDFEQNQITEVETISFDLNVIDEDSFDTLLSQSVTVEP